MIEAYSDMKSSREFSFLAGDLGTGDLMDALRLDDVLGALGGVSRSSFRSELDRCRGLCSGISLVFGSRGAPERYSNS